MFQVLAGVSHRIVVFAKSIDEKYEEKIDNKLLSLNKRNAFLQSFLAQFDLCVTGRALERLETTNLYEKVLLPRVFVYARVSPSQKEYVLCSLKQAGYNTLMCGDGTNDVGALKQAHVGVALLNGTPEDLEKIARTMRERRLREFRKKQEEMYRAWGVEPPKNGEEPRDRRQGAIHKQQKMMNDMMESMEAIEEPPVLKFGDASVAAPFTSKLSSLTSSMQSLSNMILIF